MLFFCNVAESIAQGGRPLVVDSEFVISLNGHFKQNSGFVHVFSFALWWFVTSHPLICLRRSAPQRSIFIFMNYTIDYSASGCSRVLYRT